MQPIPNNPLFSKSKIYVMYHGENRNGSNLSKENVERHLATIKNIPIIGEFEKESDNFKGHGGKLEITEDDMEFIHTTKPLGVVPESATTYWEIIKDKKGIDREYLVVDGAYMWNRYEKEVNALKEDNFGQSMELEVFDGEWIQDDRVFDIKDFAFSALCILGIDRDGSGHVEPAFGDAKIITYSKSDLLKDELSEMLKEFKYSLSKDVELGSKEGNELNLEDLLKKYSITVEDLDAKSIKYSELTIEELEQEIEKSFSEEDESGKDESEGEEGQEDESEDDKQEDEQEDKTDEDEDKKEDEEPNQFELEVQSLKAENEGLKTQLEAMQSEIAEFKKNDHEREANSILSRFKADYDLEDSDISEISIHDFSLEQLESKLFEIVGRKMKSQKEDFEAKPKLKFNLDKDEKRDVPVYDSLFQSIKK